MTRYVIQRRSDHWFWCGPAPADHANQWISHFVPKCVCTYERPADAEMVGLGGCPLPLDQWTVVKIPDETTT